VPEYPSPAQLHLDLRDPHQHLVRASLRFQPRTAVVRLRLPAWTPGSYLIRDYVRWLEGLQVYQNGRPLAVERLEPACWQFECLDRGTDLAQRAAPAAPIELHWRLLAEELTVRTCHLTADHGFLALAAVVLQVEGERWSPWRLTLALPPGWQPFLSLPADGSGGWLARNFDHLIDSPLELGPHRCHGFVVAGVPHRWVGWGEDLPSRDPAWLADVERVCQACCRLMGVERPAAAAYLFVLHLLAQGYGGLEHDDGTVLQFGRRALRQADGRRKLLQLVAHEYLHQWNGRRLRPAELCPIDYDRATLVPSLWFVEGVTSYYDLLLPLAAGISDQQELLADLGAQLSRYRLTPGKMVQSLQLSSQEAWVKLYRPDPHAPDCQISYYLKGAVLALVLDLHLRRHGAALALVLQRLWQSHGIASRGYRQSDLVEAFAHHAHDLSTLLPFWLESEQDPDIDGYLADVGLVLVAERSPYRDAGWTLASGGTSLTRVMRGGAAERAGLQLGDELLAIDQQRLRTPEDACQLLVGSPDSVALHVHFCRDGLLRQTSLQCDPPAVERWQLAIDPDAPATAATSRARWLSLLP
jgi:predicted metalloprotease with PDZ domain